MKILDAQKARFSREKSELRTTEMNLTGLCLNNREAGEPSLDSLRISNAIIIKKNERSEYSYIVLYRSW